MLKINKCYNENCLDTMKSMEENSIDLVVTSPPYGNSIRLYNGFSFDFELIAKELYRVLKPGSILVWVVGNPVVKKSISLDAFKQGIFFVEQCGFTFHESIIYEKSSFSFPSKNKYHNIWEHIFVMSKGKPNVFNPIIDREIKYTQSRGKSTQRQADGSLKDTGRGIIKYNKVGKRCNIFRYAVGFGNSSRDKIAFAHSAIYPEKLAEDAILSYSNFNDVIYDPFLGSGTTAKMAIKNNRKFVGSEISEEYCNIIKERLGLEDNDIIKN